MTSRVRAIFARRSVLRLLIGRDLKLKYERSALGYIWTVLEPLLMATIYYFVFSRIGRIRIDDYPLFIIAAYIPWMWFQGAIRASTSALNASAKLVRTSNLPREIWVLRVIGAKLSEYVLALPVVVLFAVLSTNHKAPSLYLLALPLAIVIQTMMLTGIGLLLASVTVVASDIQRLIRVLMRLAFYLSPIVYDSAEISRRLGGFAASIFELNPLVGPLELNRAVWFPERFAGWDSVGISLAVSIALLFGGWAVFRRLEHAVLKEV